MKITTIDFGSFDCMKVVGITENYDNMTMSLPVQILGKLNADEMKVRYTSDRVSPRCELRG